MPSLLHEGLIQLIRDQPQLAASLLELLRVEVPELGEPRMVESELNELTPTEYDADALVLFGHPKPAFGVVIEVQRGTDDDKRFTWPVYVTSARARHRCPVVLIVVTLTAAMERWSSQPILIGGNLLHRPYVVGPSGIPKVTERARARRDPQLALLSLVVHGRGDVDAAVAITVAVAAAIERFPDRLRRVYSALMELALSPDAQEALKMEPQVQKLFSESQRKAFVEGEARGEAKGNAAGKAEALLLILGQRRLALSPGQRRTIESCTDAATLRHWLEHALSAASVDELLG